MALRVVKGGRSDACSIGGVIVDLASASPLAEDAKLSEEDTYLVLSASPEIRPVREHPIRTMTALWDQQPEELGKIIEKPGGRWLAVVHDLAAEPTADEATVRKALARALELAAARGVKTLGMELLGAMHGALSPETALDLLREALEAAPGTHLHVVLHVAEPHRARVEAWIAKLASNSGARHDRSR